MPISSVTNGSTYLPVQGREARSRPAIVEIDDKSGEVSDQRGEAPRQLAELGAGSERRVITAVSQLDSQESSQRFRASPSFENLSSAQSNAVLSYLSTQSLGSATAPAGSELIVGVDTFV